jgi:3-demethoxyubiquinol 3-hydroxylase
VCWRDLPNDAAAGNAITGLVQAGLAVTNIRPDDTLTVLYDGSCPLCRREIVYLQSLARQALGSGLCFADVASEQADPAFGADRDKLLARFHVQQRDGTRLSGAAAFVAMWARLPGWRWLARLAQVPGMLFILEFAYGVFLSLRPPLQAVVRRWESKHKRF